MGSGLILLVIVGAWLAVLVPMGLRSHDSASSARSAERFGDAMRVLARRSPPGSSSRSVAVPPRGGSVAMAVAAGQDSATRVLRGLRESAAAHRSPDGGPGRAPVTAAQRRRRVLAGLLLVALVTLVGGLVGPSLLLLVSGVSLVLAALFLVSCRRQVLAQAERRAHARQAVEEEPVAVRVLAPAAPRRAVFVDVPAVPVEAPTTELPVAAAHVRVARGGEWQPVPVPPPMYVGKAVAPPRPATRTVQPDGWSAELPAAGPAQEEPEDVLERRRAVGGW